MCIHLLCKVKDLPFALDLCALKAHASPRHPLFWQCILCTDHIWISPPRGQTGHVTVSYLFFGWRKGTGHRQIMHALLVVHSFLFESRGKFVFCKLSCTNSFASVEFFDWLGWSAVLICSDTPWSKETVTCNISLTEPKKIKTAQTQWFLETLYWMVLVFWYPRCLRCKLFFRFWVVTK